MGGGLTALLVSACVAGAVLVWVVAETVLGAGADRLRERPSFSVRWQRRPGLRTAGLALLGLGAGAGVLGAAALTGDAAHRGEGLDLVGAATALVLVGVSLLAAWWRLAGRHP